MPAEGRRVALVIGQNSYKNLTPLSNAANDASRMAALLRDNGFDLIGCIGDAPACIDQTRNGLLAAVATLRSQAKDADLALIFYAGHGLETGAGNVLVPIDATIDCPTMSVGNSVVVAEFLAAAAAAKRSVIILDACRDEPLGKICKPVPTGRAPSFKKIEPSELRNLLLVTSTQFGQQAKDGPPGKHSPFADALFAALQANPRVYFDQIMNQVAKDTYDTVLRLDESFKQIPGRVVGGETPADCLAGRDCVGDIRMSALADKLETLAAESKAAQADAAGIRAVLEVEQGSRGKPYTAEERAKRIAELGETLTRIGASGDPQRQEARRLIDSGNLEAGQSKLDEALATEERAALEAEQLAARKRKAAAQSARDLAVLSRGSNVAKAAA
jgi:hypothetical protein